MSCLTLARGLALYPGPFHGEGYENGWESTRQMVYGHHEDAFSTRNSWQERKLLRFVETEVAASLHVQALECQTFPSGTRNILLAYCMLKIEEHGGRLARLYRERTALIQHCNKRAVGVRQTEAARMHIVNIAQSTRATAQLRAKWTKLYKMISERGRFVVPQGELITWLAKGERYVLIIRGQQHYSHMLLINSDKRHMPISYDYCPGMISVYDLVYRVIRLTHLALYSDGNFRLQRRSASKVLHISAEASESLEDSCDYSDMPELQDVSDSDGE
ncbi:hypothetical protein DFH06DRAFT_1119598 [Mycena polygramma]|nr:hypothetical protein DFH06DRAFT_1119598 [Mycena polygramma]